jgi:hypothetical protein
MSDERISPLRRLRRKIAYYPIGVRSLYTEVPRAAGKIPNRVYQTWVRPVLPLVLAIQVRRFRRLNPDFSFSFFDDQRMADYMSSNYAGHPILKVFKDLRMPVLKADIWRYCILFREGGIYCDIKSTLTIPFRELLHDDPSELVSFEALKWRDLTCPGPYADPGIFLPAPPDSVSANLEHPDNTILNWMLCFEKGSPILEELINLIVRHSHFFSKRIFENVSMAGNHLTGVIAVTQAVWMWMKKTGKRPMQCGINYAGHGVWKVRGMNYGDSPHHTTMKNKAILD